MTKKYGENVVVDGLALEVADGEFFTLLGPSGCGKTTTLRCVAGLERPDEGRIQIGGEVVFDSTTGKAVPPEKRNAGMVFQSYALWPHMSVLGNVSYPMRRRGASRDEARRRAMEALEVVSLTAFAQRSVTALSGGQQQRVALARALVAQPRLILFDEPLSNLDAKLRGDMRDQIAAVQKRVGTTSIYVTHDQTEALTLSDRIAVMNAGCVQQIGTPEQIYSRPANHFVADFVGFENLLEGRITANRDGRATVSITDIGDLEVNDVDPDIGPDVVVAVRAGDLVLTSAPPGPANSFRGRVRKVTYLGEQVELHVQCRDRLLRARIGARLLHQTMSAIAHEGADVAVVIPPSAPAVMPADPPRAV